MKLPKYLTTITPFSKFAALTMLIALPFVGFYCGIYYQKMLSQFQSGAASVDLNNKDGIYKNEKIAGYNLTSNCSIDITLRSGKIIKSAIVLNNSGMKTQPCIQKFEPHISNSEKYMSFFDITGGIDSVIRIYSVDKNKTTNLYVYGTSTIIDSIWAQENDIFFVLNGYPGIPSEQYLTAYDIQSLYKNYDNNILKGYDQFNIDKKYEKSLKLIDYGIDYNYLRSSTDSVFAYTLDPKKFTVFSKEDYRFEND